MSIAQGRRRAAVPCAALAAALAALLMASPAGATTLPPGFQETAAFSGLNAPTAIRFAPAPGDTRVFVAEKSGRVLAYDSVADTSPTQAADLRTEVFNADDRGLLGLAVDPAFPVKPYLYVLYSHDSYGGQSPRWGTAGATDDACPTPPGPTTDGCVIDGRLSRLQLDPATHTLVPGGEKVLVDGGWCQQFPSHSIGDLAFGADGMLYASGGDGASFNYPDYGQSGGTLGSPPIVKSNPCSDPPGGPGSALTPPTAEGGSLRAQDLRTPSDPTGLDGALIRVDPGTGDGATGNPLAASPDANARRIVAEGFRNPYRIAVRPGTSEPWVADVGDITVEEIDRVPAPTDSAVDDFGWPCYEGPARHAGWDALNVSICENLYAAGPGAVSAPAFSYTHSAPTVPGDGCSAGSGAVSGLAFYGQGPYPTAYQGALFFADYARDCVWWMKAGAGGVPDPASTAVFAKGAVSTVDLQAGPDGALYRVDPWHGSILRIGYTGPGTAPVARAAAAPTDGAAPLAVDFDGRASTDADPGQTAALDYAWDLDGDGAYDDGTGPTPSRTYPRGTFVARLKVTDPDGWSGVSAPITVNASNSAPVPAITLPAPGLRWSVGDTLDFAGSASDAQDGTLAATRLQWTLDLDHCPSSCHVHRITTFDATAGGSFVAPDHGYPAHLTLTLTATDSDGAVGSASVDLFPATAPLSLDSDPPGLTVGANGEVGAAPLERTVIANSSNSVAADPLQAAGGATWAFSGWSDGGLPAHQVTVPGSGLALTATFNAPPPGGSPPAGPTGGPATPPPAAAPPAGAAAPGLTVSGRARQLADRHGRFSVDARCASRCVLAARATATAPGLRSRLDAGGARATAGAQVRQRLVLGLPAGTLRTLRQLERVRLRLPVTVEVTATGPGGGRTVRRLSVSLGGR